MNAQAVLGWTKKLPLLRGRRRAADAKGWRATFFLEFTVIFAIVALVLTLATGLGLSRYLGEDIKNKTIEDVALFTEQVTATQIANHLRPEQLAAPLQGEELEAFDRFVHENLLGSAIIRVNVWNSAGTVVYSSYGPLTGQNFFLNEHLQRAVAGETEAELEGVEEGVEGSGLEGYDRIVEVYTPINFDDASGVIGAFEIYRDYGPVAAHIADVQRSIQIGIGVALATLYFILLFVVRRGSDLIRRQQGDLQAKSQELKNSYDSIVAVLCSALDLRDNVTHGHAKRVSELASTVAWQMGLRKDEVRQIEKAAILHDIGKIGVADAVLSKAGPLDEVEWQEMKRHPELGYLILQGIDFLRDAADVVYSHHERFDGKGYPRGLKGDQIPLGARVFAVVDAYDAMTSDRPYRKAMAHRKAKAEIVRNSITQFDPEVVRAFVEAERRGMIKSDNGDDSASEVDDAFALVEPGEGAQPRRGSPPQE